MDTVGELIVPAGPDAVPDRDRARKHVQDRRDFGSHLVAFVVVNTFLVLVWALTGAGYFWPAWVLGAWGVGLVLHAWETFVRRPITEADIDAELQRHRRQSRGTAVAEVGTFDPGGAAGAVRTVESGADSVPSSQGRIP
jgi:2TM domain